MKTFTKIVAFTVISLPLLANAAGKTASASMQVTFEVKEACTVQSADHNTKAAPTVSCQLNTPYQAQAQATTTAASIASSGEVKAAAPRQQAADGVWTITF